MLSWEWLNGLTLSFASDSQLKDTELDRTLSGQVSEKRVDCHSIAVLINFGNKNCFLGALCDHYHKRFSIYKPLSGLQHQSKWNQNLIVRIAKAVEHNFGHYLSLSLSLLCLLSSFHDCFFFLHCLINSWFQRSFLVFFPRNIRRFVFLFSPWLSHVFIGLNNLIAIDKMPFVLCIDCKTPDGCVKLLLSSEFFSNFFSSISDWVNASCLAGP